MKRLPLVPLVALLAGCGAPVLRIDHGTLAALPVPDDVRRVEVHPFEVTDGPEDSFGRVLAGRIIEALRPTGRYEIPPASGPVDATLGGTIEIESRDAPGRRTVRGRTAEGVLVERAVETLERHVTVHTTMVLRRAGGGDVLATAETREAYDSLMDEAAYGALGLARPDDPANVPPVAAIAERLLDVCGVSLARMLTPVEVRAEVPLREAEGDAARRGLDAAREGRYPDAAARFEEALEARPGDAALHFNLAAVLEAGGDLAAAHDEYKSALAASDGADPEAHDGVVRTHAVMEGSRLPVRRAR